MRRWVAPALVIIGVLLIVTAAGYVRGTWADREPRDPASPDDGVICRLYRPEGEDWQVRCSVILDHPPDRVQQVITDYDNFKEIFSTLESAQVERRDDGSYRMTGEARSMIGTWPFDITVIHEESPGRFRASWAGESGEVQKVKGGWTVTPAGEGRTLLVYSSHVEIDRYPDWVVVNALLQRQPKVMRAVAERLGRAAR